MHSRHPPPRSTLAIEIRPYQPGDEDELLSALNARERSCVESRTAISSEELTWFQAHPRGSRTYLALDPDRNGALVGHLSAAPHAVWMNGQEHRFAELFGGFVASEYRQGLAKRGVYARLCRELFSNHQGVEGDFIYYGWPTPEEWRLGRKQLSFEAVRTQIALTRAVPGDGMAPGGLLEIEGLERFERFDHQARWLWDRCAGGFGASALRDEEFLNHRFVERPGHDYELLGVRDGEGVLRGYAVFRVGTWNGRSTGLVCDWLVPCDEPEVGALLLRGLDACARNASADELFCLLPEWSPWFDRFQRAGFLATDAGRMLIARSKARRFDAFWMRTQWYSTLADTLIV